MNEPLIIRPMRSGEETQVVDLVERVFNEFIAPLYTQEGVAEFFKYAQADALAQRLRAGPPSSDGTRCTQFRCRLRTTRLSRSASRAGE